MTHYDRERSRDDYNRRKLDKKKPKLDSRLEVTIIIVLVFIGVSVIYLF